MAKAHIERPDGTRINLEGTPAEIAAVVNEVGDSKPRAQPARGKAKAKGKEKTTVTTLVDGLKTEGFFKKPKTLGDVRTRLADLGHSYPLTGLSGPMRREVRKKRLRRFKENGKYVYAQ
jgi:hypothetical protein